MERFDDRYFSKISQISQQVQVSDASLLLRFRVSSFAACLFLFSGVRDK